MFTRLPLLLFALGLMVVQSGCPSSSEYEERKRQLEQKQAEAQNADPKASSDAGLQEFTPPPLEELVASVEWEDSRVVDPLELYREHLETKEQLATVDEALSLKNDSEEANAKIMSALGRMYESKDQVNFDDELIRHAGVEVKSTNPLMMSSTVEFDVVGMMGVGLFSFDWNMEPLALSDYVKSWKTSKDKLYDMVVLRDDMTWSDGTPITAHDIEFSFKTIMDPEIPIPAVRTGMEDMKWVEAYDDHTIVFFHKQSLATNVWNCNFPIIPKHVYETTIPEDKTMANSDRHVELESDPVVGGAYKLVKRTKSEILLERRDDWYMHDGKQVRRKPHFKRIRFQVIADPNTQRLALNRGDIHDLELQATQWVTQTNDEDFYKLNTKVRGEQWVYYFIGWNVEKPQFTDVKVRKALAYAVDYDYIMNKLLHGLWPPCTGTFHPDSWMGPTEARSPYKQDLEKAVALLEEAGWKDTDSDGIRDKEIGGKKRNFEFVLTTPNQPWRVDVCNSFANTLSRIGIKCTVSATEFTVFQEQSRDHDFDAIFGGWGTGTDPSTTANIFKTAEGRNYGQYSNKRVDELFDLAKLELDRDKRAEYYREIDEILWDEQAYCFLFYRSAFYGFNKKLRGYMFSPRGPYHYAPGFDAIWAAAK